MIAFFNDKNFLRIFPLNSHLCVHQIHELVDNNDIISN